MKKKIAVLLATWFKSGFIPPFILKGMAGTYGSFFSLPLCLLAVALARRHTLTVWHGQQFLYPIFILAILCVGLWSIPIAEAAIGPQTDWKGRIKTHDQNQIVIDETFGMLVSCWPFVYTHAILHWWHFALAFGLFRLFDITKPPLVSYFDRKNTAWGVMMDDGVAGVYAAICLIITLRVF